jgi:hypothetical protein
MDPSAAPTTPILETAVDTPAPAPGSRRSTALRVARYVSSRLVILLITAVISVWVTIIAANLGGYVDEIQRRQIREAVGMSLRPDPDLTPEEMPPALKPCWKPSSKPPV